MFSSIIVTTSLRYNAGGVIFFINNKIMPSSNNRGGRHTIAASSNHIIIIIIGMMLLVLPTTVAAFRRRGSSVSSLTGIITATHHHRRRLGHRGGGASLHAAFINNPSQQQQQHRKQQSSSTLIINHRTTTIPTTTKLFFSSVTKDAQQDTKKETTPSPSSSSTIDTKYDLTNAANGLANTSYDPSTFETSIYEWWETSGCFDPDSKQPPSQISSKSSSNNKLPYVLPMPPPNVTGKLHMGHAIFVALQDVLARYHRMRGRPVLWLPGTDHAGIATQLQVEKLLAKEGKRRATPEAISAATKKISQEKTDGNSDDNDDELSKLVNRDDFLKRVWQYKEEQGSSITYQLRSLGASADWNRERFTMDSELSQSVTEAFCRLYDKGLIYRGTYMVNWSRGLMTAVSDLEVEYSEENGKLYYFKYIVEKNEENDDDEEEEEEYLAVATTRPETIFGDTAVCVNPNDDRYKHLIGKRVLVPISHETNNNNGGKQRSIPIIADEYVDMDFGTGALKITPGHDPNDYDLGKKYNLNIINVMNKDGTMNDECGPRYVGLDRFTAREVLWEDMTKSNLVLKVEPHVQRVPRSQRGGEIIEPLVSKQWFVKTENMGSKALDAVKNGDITIVPSRFEKVWYGWLTDIRDW